jgi:hypothetical protein
MREELLSDESAILRESRPDGLEYRKSDAERILAFFQRKAPDQIL